MRLRVLSSGSKGNVLAVRSAGGVLALIDLGLQFSDLRSRAEACGIDVSTAAGILFTHDHSDHFSSLSAFHRRHPLVPLFANGDTADSIASKTGVADGWSVFETAVPFDLADFRITPFSVSHDAADPVGFLLESGGRILFVGSDTGMATLGVRDALRRSDCAVLETNYDPVLLETSNRPEVLKQRIAGRSGHLSNDDAADLVRSVNPPRMKTLLLAHLSEECNTPSLARAAICAALDDCGRHDVRIEVLSQNEPGELVEI
ncbi:MAG: hypothetical protein IKO72_09525 [Kiritimatiellae bacterium]|nr:hypothetical protein [Kiritimatiellia bacterium]